ncbi:MAG: tripartite tricarboxylate transporter substrate-binding protein, partial [Xanthobacteraceae bacterium]
LGVAARQRLPALPAVPTMIESGVKDFIASSWTGILAPAGTPPEIVARLNAAINAGLTSADMQARFRQLNAETKPGTPQDFADFIAVETRKWSAVAKMAGLSLD